MLQASEKPPWLQLLIAVVPVALAPTIAWVLAQRRETRQRNELELLQLRIALLEKILALRPQLPKDPADPVLGEVLDVLAELEALRTREGSHISTASDHSRLTRWFLLYPQRSMKATIYKVLFYGFTGFGLLALLGSIIDQSPTAIADRPYLFLGILLYLGVGAAFRIAAIRDYIRRGEKDRIVRKSGSYGQDAT